MMPDQMFETFRKAATSSMQMQQDMFKQWSQQWPWPANATGGSADWAQRLQSRWAEFTGDLLKRQRESFETMYKLAIELIEQTSRLYESKSPEEYSRGMEELRNKMFESLKERSDAQMQEFQKTAEKWFDVLLKA